MKPCFQMQETRMHPSAQTLCGISSHVLADILTALKFFGERTGDCGELKNKTFTLYRQEEPSQNASLQLLVLRLGFHQDRDVGVGVFEREVRQITAVASARPQRVE